MLLHVLARYINLVIEFVPLYVYINLVMVLNLIEAVSWPMVAEYPLKIRPGKFLHRKSGYFEVLSLIDLLASTNLLHTMVWTCVDTRWASGCGQQPCVCC